MVHSWSAEPNSHRGKPAACDLGVNMFKQAEGRLLGHPVLYVSHIVTFSTKPGWVRRHSSALDSFLADHLHFACSGSSLLLATLAYFFQHVINICESQNISPKKRTRTESQQSTSWAHCGARMTSSLSHEHSCVLFVWGDSFKKLDLNNEQKTWLPGLDWDQHDEQGGIWPLPDFCLSSFAFSPSLSSKTQDEWSFLAQVYPRVKVYPTWNQATSVKDNKEGAQKKSRPEPRALVQPK